MNAIAATILVCLALSTLDANAGEPPTLPLKIPNPATLPGGDGGEGDTFGQSVAIDGDTAVVGAPGDMVNGVSGHGAVYVFVRNAGTWEVQQKLAPTDGSVPTGLGISVAIAGDTLVAGASLDSSLGLGNAGAAYVFVRDNGTWTQQAKLVAEFPQAGALFGSAVAISGNAIVVGAVFEDVGIVTDNGAAYYFLREGTTWGAPRRIIELTQRACGTAVAISPDTIVVGCSGTPINNQQARGCAWVYLHEPSGGLQQQQRLIANDGIDFDGLGTSVAIVGDIAAVGASAFSSPSVYFFQRSNTVWTQGPRLRGGSGTAFGQAVAMTPDILAVGIPAADIDGRADQGAIVVYARTGGTGVVATQTVLATDGADGDYFGFDVALSGTDLIGGAPYERGDAMDAPPNTGAVYIDRAAGDAVFGDGFE